jgi:hypothetical protein
MDLSQELPVESRLYRDSPASREMNFIAQISKYGGLWHDNKCASCRDQTGSPARIQQVSGLKLGWSAACQGTLLNTFFGASHKYAYYLRHVCLYIRAHVASPESLYVVS